MSEHDPGDLYEPNPPRRRRSEYRGESEFDDAWAAADEDDLADPGVDIEDLAAGYHWEDRDPYGVNPPDAPETGDAPDLGPLPDSVRRVRQRSGPPVRRSQPNPQTPYPDSPTYQRDRGGGRPEEFYTPPVAPRSVGPRPAGPGPVLRPSRGVPFWQILLLVLLGMTALLAVALACGAVLSL